MAAQEPFIPSMSTNTQLDPANELAFRQWVIQNKVPFNPEAQTSDYDMRGYYQGLQQGQPMAKPSEVNPNDQRLHYPDYYKTPSHQSFSSESQWAGSNTPAWINKSQLAAPSGKVVFDENQKSFTPELPQDAEQMLRALLGNK